MYTLLTMTFCYFCLQLLTAFVTYFLIVIQFASSASCNCTCNCTGTAYTY
jgi:hypothetical protein